MATTTKHPGDFILEVASTGASLMTSFTKFLTYRKVSDNNLENLYATISITTSSLLELGSTINDHEKDFSIKDEITKQITQKCKENFDKLLVFVNEAVSQGVWKQDGTIGGTPVTSEVDPWFLITLGIGGWDEAESFWRSLNNVRDTLLRLKDTVKYMILKDLKEKSLLEPVEAEELEQLTTLLPHLVQNFEKAEKGKKEAAELNYEREGGSPPNMRRTDSDGFSDITLPVNNERGGGREFVKDIDCESLYSDRSFDLRPLQDNEVVYEEWVLQYHHPNRRPDYSHSFLGLKIKGFYENPGFWVTSPELRSQTEMKEQHLSAAAGMSAAKHMDAVKKAIRMIPKDGGRQIDTLVQERTRCCSDETVKRQWSVVALNPQEKYPYSSTKKWGKDPLRTNWFVTLRGETVDTIVRHQPYRGEDAWRKRDWHRERSFSPRRTPYREDRVIEVMPRRRYQPIVGGERRPIDPPWTRQPRCDAVNEKNQTGTLVVAKLMSQDEAEKKLVNIWVEMNKEASAETAA